MRSRAMLTCSPTFTPLTPA
jgi:hypothetical protein